MPHTFRPGDAVYVLLFDTPLPGVIEGRAGLDDMGGRQWNVITEAASHAYSVPESALRPYAAGPNFT